MPMLSQLPIPRLRQNPRLIDTAVSIALLASMLLSIATRAAQPGQFPNSWATYLTAVTMALPYPFHRRYPLAAVAVVLLSVLIYSSGDFAAFPGLNAFVMVFGVALHSQRRRHSVIAFAATMVVMTVAVLIQPAGIVDEATWISTELATVVFWLGGDNLRQRRARWTALKERNEFLEREREERARKAVTEERLRIARELHDVVAHAMSVITVQSGVGNHDIATQPAEAQKALAAIETTSTWAASFESLAFESHARPAGFVRGNPAIYSSALGGSGTLAWESAPGEVTYIGYSGAESSGDAIEALRTLADLGRTLTPAQWEAKDRFPVAAPSG